MSKKFWSLSSIVKAILFFSTFITYVVSAKEGMWLPANLKQQEADMIAAGLQVPVNMIYNENGTGLNNAVVLFGRGCTGEVISSKGLLLTNHHCGYSSVQALSSTLNDYFANGFWAKNNNEELPCPGLTVTFIRKMKDVTGRVLYGMKDTLHGHVRSEIVAARIKYLENKLSKESGLEVIIKPYFEGNQYWASYTETFKDIRLVGFPPNGVGYFGGDFENWVWPRHTGDFSMFRIYAGADNKPAMYAKDNKPYRTKTFFKINASGYKEGDFTMVYGFPGTTKEYISSYQMNDIYSITDPVSIAVRTQRLQIWDQHMNADRLVFLKYTSKRAGVANGWKKWQGEVRGLRINDVLTKKVNYERGFQQWADANDSAYPYAKDLLANMQVNTVYADSALKTTIYISEAVMGCELIQQGGFLGRMVGCFRAGLNEAMLRDTLMKICSSGMGFYKNYDSETDKDVFKTLLPLYFQNCPHAIPAYYLSQYADHNNDISSWADDVYNISMAVDYEKMKAFATNATASDSSRLLSDPAWQLYNSIQSVYKTQGTKLTAANEQLTYLNRLYMKCRMVKDEFNHFYPDANLTLRVAYGKVKGLDPDGPVGYSYQTNLDEVVALDDPDVEVFKVPQKLKDLYKAKDYGKWGVKGKVPVAFIADNHTSGGNSGSPVLNAKGELIGTNFDRAWEGTMSDLYFDPALCRNISLDVRYVLFIMEKLGGAGWLLNEMQIVR